MKRERPTKRSFVVRLSLKSETSLASRRLILQKKKETVVILKKIFFPRKKKTEK